MSSTESLYSRLGGEPVLREFVEQLYGFMETMPEVAHVRAMHSEDLSHASDRLFMFLSGMLGGPDLYVEAFGHPRLRRKHLHFSIGNKERDQWLLCAQHAVNQLDVAGHIGEELMNNLRVMANHLRNQGTLDSMPQQYNGPDRRNVK
ncbi:MAG: group II truncated hemoglobin [Proteobacteria bacterium]|nr:group II truncated hemoglobin [Pseudomonadota bacterium]